MDLRDMIYSEQRAYLEEMADRLVRIVGENPGIKTREAYTALAREMGIVPDQAKYGVTFAKATHRIKLDWTTFTLSVVND